MTTEEFWRALPGGVQAEFDALTGRGLNIRALHFLREKCGMTPVPDLKECVELLDHRARVLRERDRPDRGS